MTYGEDPRQGFFEGNVFYHPDLRFQIAFPQGWKTQNGADAVVAVSPQQDAMMQLGLAGKTPPQQAVQQFLSQQGVQAGQTSSTSINGLPAASGYFQAQSDQGTVEGLVTFVSYNGNTYGLLGYTPGGKLSQYDAVLRQSDGQLRRAPELRRAQREARPGRAGEAPAPDDAGAVQCPVPIVRGDNGAGNHQ